MRLSGLTRRETLKLGGAFGAVATGGSLISVTARSQDLARVDMQLGWLASNGQLGEIAAKREGFYDARGIQFSITPGGPNVDGVASVAAGRSQVGNLSSSPSLMLARSAGIPVKAIAAGYQQHPFTYFSLASDPIREPGDMIGKTIATQPTAFILARALLAKHGISEDEVELVNMGSDMGQLMTGQAAAVTGWLTNTNALRVIGADRVDMRLWDTGIRLYANVYYTTDRMLEQHEDVLVRYLAATAEGWGWAKQNPEAAVDHLLAEYPNLDRESELEAVVPVLEFSFNEVTKEHGWGHMERANWEEQIRTYAELDQFTGSVPTVEEVMSSAILDATSEIRHRVG